MNQCGKGVRCELVGRCCRIMFLGFLLIVPASLMAQNDAPANQVPASEPSTGTEVSAVASPEPADELDRAKKAIADYQQNRLNFEYKKGNVKQEVAQELNELNAQIGALEQELQEGERQLERVYRPGEPDLPEDLQEAFAEVRDKRSSYETALEVMQGVNISGAFFLSPWTAFAGGRADRFLYVFLPITVLNIFLYLYFRQPTAYARYKKFLITVLVLVFLAGATSLIAAPLDKRQEVESQLRQTEGLLKLTGNQKAIAILEGRYGEQIALPPRMASGDARLASYTTVTVDSPEYFSTLASLYSAEGNIGKAIELLSRIAENRGLSGAPNERILVSTVKYLVDNGYTDTAGIALTNHVGQLNDTATLLSLADYLREHSLQASSVAMLERAQKITKDTSGKVVLAEYFYTARKADTALELLREALERSRDIGDIILVSEASIKLQAADEVLKKVPAKAKGLNGSVGQLIALSRIFFERGESDTAALFLERSVNGAGSFAQLQETVQALIEFNQGQLMEKVRAKAIMLAGDLTKPADDESFASAYRQALGFVDYLVRVNRVEDGTKLFEDVVKKIKQGRKKDQSYVSLMLDCARDGLRRGMKKQAADIVLELTFTDPREKAYSSYLALHEDFLKSLREIPDTDTISIPLFHGLINEDIQRLEDSERVYIQAVIYTLGAINEQYGDFLPETLNEFYLLGRLWQKEQRVDELLALDRVYTLLEGKILEHLQNVEREKLLPEPRARLAMLKAERERQLVEVQNHEAEIERLTAEYEKRRQEKAAAARLELQDEKKELNVMALRVLARLLATLVNVAAMVLLFLGCAFLARKYSDSLHEHKAFGFFTRFVEVNGWLRVFSIIGIVSGVVLVLVAQFFQIIHKLHELTLQAVGNPCYADSVVVQNNQSRQPPVDRESGENT